MERPESPALYTLFITLRDVNGAVLEVLAPRVGLRTVEVRGGRLLVHGRPVTLRGVNRHEHEPKTGHVVSEAMMRRDIELMKELNFNCVRCSHYPNDERWYELCDELGLYVIDEANIESHGMGFELNRTLAGLPDFHDAHMERVKRVYERDKNHASVIIWSLGNEAGNGAAFREAYGWLKRRDPSRPVQYENARIEPGWSTEQIETIDYNTDIYVPMYPSPAKLEKYAQRAEFDAAAHPLIMCVYSHAMGNSCGGLEQYWDVINAHGVLQGGCIWDWVDQGLLLPPPEDENGFASSSSATARPHFGYGGDFGPKGTPSDEAFCINGLVQPDRLPNPHAYEAKWCQQPIAVKRCKTTTGLETPQRGRHSREHGTRVLVTNRHDFTPITTEHFTFMWLLLLNGDIVGRGEWEPPRCAPHEICRGDHRLVGRC